MKSVFIFSILIFQLILPLHAQQIFGLTYDICVPILDTKEHVSNISFVGFGLDARQMMNEKVSFGVTFHWNSFKDDRLEKVDTGEGSFIAIDDRTLESFPILLSSHFYFFGEMDNFRPYIGTNVGTYFIIQRSNVDGIRRVYKNWHLGLAPDVGFMIKFMRDVHIMLTLRFNYAAPTGGSPAQTYWSVLFGFVSVSLF